ncbi:hypothetical protein [Acinetobacter sp. ANC 3813]|uniref:hypothetical protein n=1 Tax=Acinetobacter sp. ANC 3813 TaxID=1977873 RepID=UPI000A34ACC8|nr:hypothetical protein [Acinetobacter sp. ANC 3813]OTG87851.1 hypothetical protein B9T34_16070 [Acinetobacter sp. ANC 3813]
MKASKRASKETIMYDRLPPEGKQAVKAFGDAIRVYFKNQTLAGQVLKCHQGKISKYMQGVNLVPLEVARRFSQYTNGVLSEESIFFDYWEWVYDQAEAKKEADLKAA